MDRWGLLRLNSCADMSGWHLCVSGIGHASFVSLAPPFQIPYTPDCLRGGYTHRARYLMQGRFVPALFLYLGRIYKP